MMRKFAKPRKDEAGFALAVTLTLLMVAAIMLLPLLFLMTTGLTSADIREESMQRFYAADAGIEDGAYRILHYYVDVPTNVGEESSYALGQELNNCTVDVTIYKAEEVTYRITSTSTDNVSNRSTTIESYVSISLADFSGLFDNAITSPSNVTIQPNSTVVGNVQYEGALDNKGDIYGEEIIGGIGNWPTADQLSDYYRCQVDVLDPFPDDTVDLNGYGSSLGPLYRDGSLTIKNTAAVPWGVELGGTVYVTGDLVVLPDCMIVLSGETIYAEGSIVLQPGCAISGSGCIIAVGNLDFQPSISFGEDDFAFLLSIAGNVTLRPADSFYGCVAGNVDVDVQPNCSLEYRSPSGQEIDFPFELPAELKLVTYAIE